MVDKENNSQEAEERVDSSSNHTDEIINKKVDNNVPVVHINEESGKEEDSKNIADQEASDKEKHKSVDQKNYSSEEKFRNPFENRNTAQEGIYSDQSSEKEQSFTNEKSKYFDLSTQTLETWRERNRKGVESLKQQYEDLIEKIGDLYEEKREAYVLTEERKIQKKLDKLIKERGDKQLELEKLEKDLDELNRELSERATRKRKNENLQDELSQSNLNLSREAENITAQTLFAGDDPIQSTVLYVATFFPRLNPQGFKRVISLLLEGRTKTITVIESTIIEEGKTQIKEIQKEKPLAEIWQESFDQTDKYLRNCHLKVSRQNGTQGVDFTRPYLRKDFLAYFEEEALYLGEQLQRTQKLDLILDSSDEIAEKAIDVAVKASIDYPSSYAEDWLIDLLIKIAEEDARRTSLLLERLAKLIYRLQIESDYSRSEDIAQSFLERLMSPTYRRLAFAITQDLMDKHLRSGLLGIQSAKQLLNWLRKLLDQDGLEEKDEKLQADIYNLLKALLWQSGFYFYIYDFLAILKEWLPNQDIPSGEYSLSNKTALFLLFDYCEETISRLRLEYYGEWPSVYLLFAPFKDQDTDEYSDELNILFSWLFCPNENKMIAASNVFSSFGLNNVNPLETIGLFIANWLTILFGFDNAELGQEAIDLIECMTYQIIANTSRYQQDQLIEFWTYLVDEYLDQAVKYHGLGQKKLKEQLMIRRKIIKDFKKQFKVSRKEAKLIK